jgi:hypothetical protein
MDAFFKRLEAQMSDFATEQEQIAELRELAARDCPDESSGPGREFARAWAAAILKLTGNDPT